MLMNNTRNIELTIARILLERSWGGGQAVSRSVGQIKVIVLMRSRWRVVEAPCGGRAFRHVLSLWPVGSRGSPEIFKKGMKIVIIIKSL